MAYSTLEILPCRLSSRLATISWDYDMGELVSNIVPFEGLFLDEMSVAGSEFDSSTIGGDDQRAERSRAENLIFM